MFLHRSEDGHQCVVNFLLTVEALVVRAALARMLPQRLLGVELRRIRGQIVNFQPTPVVAEPVPDPSVFVIGGVVLNKMNLAAVIGFGDLFQESQISFGIENRIPTIQEAGREQIDTSEDFDALSFSCDRHFRLMAPAGPCGVKSRVLPEGGFVFED